MTLPAEALTASGAVLFVTVTLFLLIARGWVGTKRQLDDKDAEIAALRAAAARKDEQIDKLMVIGSTVTRVLDAIEDLARQEQR